MSNFISEPIDPTQEEQKLTTTDGTYHDTMMNITIYHFKEGDNKSFHFLKEEAAFLLIEGDITFEWNGQSVQASRRSCFTDPATCLQASHDTDVTIIALSDSEVLVQSTENPKHFFSVLHSQRTIRTSQIDADKADSKGQYTINTIFDYDTAPHSNLVLTETIVPQGNWAGCAPHFHPQPEVNYYRFDKEQGFGFYSVENEVFRISNRTFAVVDGAKPHTRVTAPGYPMYMICMIRHFAGAPWRDRNTEKKHEWI